MIRRPPRSTLFPYTRSSDLARWLAARRSRRRDRAWRARRRDRRSEEHTSELQSQSNLVCRLLLEKKKKKTTLTQACAQTSTRKYDTVLRLLSRQPHMPASYV